MPAADLPANNSTPALGATGVLRWNWTVTNVGYPQPTPVHPAIPTPVAKPVGMPQRQEVHRAFAYRPGARWRAGVP